MKPSQPVNTAAVVSAKEFCQRVFADEAKFYQLLSLSQNSDQEKGIKAAIDEAYNMRKYISVYKMPMIHAMVARWVLPDFIREAKDINLAVEAMFLNHPEAVLVGENTEKISASLRRIQANGFIRQILPSMDIRLTTQDPSQIIAVYVKEYNSSVVKPLFDSVIARLSNKVDSYDKGQIIIPIKFSLNDWSLIQINLAVDSKNKISAKVFSLSPFSAMSSAEEIYCKALAQFLTENYQIDLVIQSGSSLDQLIPLKSDTGAIRYAAVVQMLEYAIDPNQDFDRLLNQRLFDEYSGSFAREQAITVLAMTTEVVKSVYVVEESTLNASSERKIEVAGHLLNPFIVMNMFLDGGKQRKHAFADIEKLLHMFAMPDLLERLERARVILDKEEPFSDSLKWIQDIYLYRHMFDDAGFQEEGLTVEESNFEAKVFNLFLKALVNVGERDKALKLSEQYNRRIVLASANWDLATQEQKCSELNHILTTSDADALNMVDDLGLAPIHYATILGDISLFRDLHNKGCDVSLRGINGVCAIHLASLNYRTDIIKYLLEISHDQLFLHDDNGNNILHYTCLGYDSNNFALSPLEFFYQNCPETTRDQLKQRNLQGLTPLLIAFKPGLKLSTNISKNDLFLALLLNRAKYNLSAKEIALFVVGSQEISNPGLNEKMVRAYIARAKTDAELAAQLTSYLISIPPGSERSQETVKNIITGGDIFSVNVLVKSKGVDKELKDQEGYSLLYQVFNSQYRSENYLIVLQMLVDNKFGLEYEKDPGLIKHGKKLLARATVMESACEEGNRAVVNILINAGVEFKEYHLRSVPEDKQAEFTDLAECFRELNRAELMLFPLSKYEVEITKLEEQKVQDPNKANFYDKKIAKFNEARKRLSRFDKVSAADMVAKWQMQEYVGGVNDIQIITEALLISLAQKDVEDENGPHITPENKLVRKGYKLRQILSPIELQYFSNYQTSCLLDVRLLDTNINYLKQKVNIERLDMVTPYTDDGVSWGLMAVCLVRQSDKIVGELSILGSIGFITKKDVEKAEFIKDYLAQHYKIDLDITKIKPVNRSLGFIAPGSNYLDITKIISYITIDLDQDLNTIFSSNIIFSKAQLSSYSDNISSVVQQVFDFNLAEELPRLRLSDNNQQEHLYNNPFAIINLLSGINGITVRGSLFYQELLKAFESKELSDAYNQFCSWNIKGKDGHSIESDNKRRMSLDHEIISNRPEILQTIQLPGSVQLLREQFHNHRHINILLKALVFCGYVENASKISQEYNLKEREKIQESTVWQEDYKEAKAEELLELIANPLPEKLNKLDEFGLTPLHYCAILGKKESLLLLHRAGASLTIPNSEGVLPIHLAALNDRADIVAYCLEQDLGLIGTKDSKGNNLSHYACFTYYQSISQNLAVFGYLLQNHTSEIKGLLAEANSVGKTAFILGFDATNMAKALKNAVVTTLILDRGRYRLSIAEILNSIIGNNHGIEQPEYMAKLIELRDNDVLSESEKAIELLKICYLPEPEKNAEDITKVLEKNAIAGNLNVVWAWINSDKFKKEQKAASGESLIVSVIRNNKEKNKHTNKIVQLLVDSGCIIDLQIKAQSKKAKKAKKDGNKTAMELVASYGDRELVNILINAGLEFTPMHMGLVPKDKAEDFADFFKQFDEAAKSAAASFVQQEQKPSAREQNKAEESTKEKAPIAEDTRKAKQAAAIENMLAEMVNTRANSFKFSNYFATDREVAEYSRLRGEDFTQYIKMLERGNVDEIDEYFANKYPQTKVVEEDLIDSDTQQLIAEINGTDEKGFVR